MGGRWRYKLIVSLKNTKFTLQRCTKNGWTLAVQTYSVSDHEVCTVLRYKDTQIMGGRWRYKLLMPLKYTEFIHYKDTAIMGGHWRYKLIVSLKKQVYTLQRYRNYG